MTDRRITASGQGFQPSEPPPLDMDKYNAVRADMEAMQQVGLLNFSEDVVVKLEGYKFEDTGQTSRATGEEIKNYKLDTDQDVQRQMMDAEDRVRDKVGNYVRGLDNEGKAAFHDLVEEGKIQANVNLKIEFGQVAANAQTYTIDANGPDLDVDIKGDKVEIKADTAAEKQTFEDGVGQDQVTSLTIKNNILGP